MHCRGGMDVVEDQVTFKLGSLPNKECYVHRFWTGGEFLMCGRITLLQLLGGAPVDRFEFK